VGSRSIFAAAGFAVSRPILRRVVMRIDFEAAQAGVSANVCELRRAQPASAALEIFRRDHYR
jgi:hypothetical protein